jgi:hypothetical protein
MAATLALTLAGGGAPAAPASPEAGARAERGGDARAEPARRAANRCRRPAARRRVRRARRGRCARLKRFVDSAPTPERLVPRVPGEEPPAGGGGPSGTPGEDPGDDPGGPSPAPLIRFASVAATEWSLTLSRPVVGAGSVTIELQNVGEDPHNLVVSPDDDSHDPLEVWPETAPGDHLRRTLPLSRGRYLLWCSLEGHEAQGMSVRLRVE